MLRLTLENFRSFVHPQNIPIVPLTLLTGENSSGKSNVLAALSVVLDPEGFPFRPGFNRPPYNLGTYDTIASYKGGRFGRADNFSLGYTYDQAKKHNPYNIRATYVQRGGQAEVSDLIVEGKKVKLEIRIKEQEGTLVITWLETGKKYTQQISDILLAGKTSLLTLYDFIAPARWLATKKPTQEEFETYRSAVDLVHNLVPFRTISIAPIRTKPERVYAQIKEAFEPTGDHIPFVLDKLLRDKPVTTTPNILSALADFGVESGLYRDIDVRKLGDKPGEPFQIMVDIGGRKRNLIDVGYGVSQSLPVIVQSVLASQNSLILMQQPEVHLHPKAQAALGTLLTALVKEGNRRIVVETHSDHIIDRVRQEVANGNISPEKINITFTELIALESKAYTLTLDNNGNIINAPSSYRAFFLSEQMRLMNRAGGNG